MQVGDLVRNIYTGNDAHIITGVEHRETYRHPEGSRYYEVDGKWMVPEEHLELVSSAKSLNKT